MALSVRKILLRGALSATLLTMAGCVIAPPPYEEPGYGDGYYYGAPGGYYTYPPYPYYYRHYYGPGYYYGPRVGVGIHVR